ncbi:hypothetical protein ACQ4PT_006032 [Festuca glaucescens]
MASPAVALDLNLNNPNLSVDTGVLFRPTHNPTPTAASMYPAAASQSWLSSPDIYPVTTHSFHPGPYLNYAEDPQPPMPHPDISFPMLNSNTNQVRSGNLVGPYLHYAQDLQTHVPRPAISFPMSNPNQSGNTPRPYLHYTQGLQNPMSHPVTSLAMPNQCANPNRGAASATLQAWRTPIGRQSDADIIPISSESESEDYFEETSTHSKSNGKAHSKSNGKASSDSLKTGGKASSFSEGLTGSGKGGKSFSAGKGGKGSASNAKPAKSDPELKLELDLPLKSIILMDCEAAEMLQQIHEHMAILSEDPKIKIPESFDKAFQYAKEGNHFTSAKSVKQILEPLKKYGVTDGEICMIANIGPETIEEVYALVPSLKATKALNESLITEALEALTNIKASK